MFISGVLADRVRTSAEGPEVSVGTIGWVQTSAGPKGYMYVRDSGSAITGDGYVALINGADFLAVMATITTSAPAAGAGKMAGVARAAIAASGYGWLQIFGAGTIRNSASCVLGTIINTTATAGQLDDDATVGSEVIDGIVLTATTAGAAALTAGFINWPKVGRTL